jgi:hypothetical protein
MASNTYNITLADGSTIALPAWATDETLRRLVAETSASKKLDGKLLNVLSGIISETSNIDSVLDELKSATNRESKKREFLDNKNKNTLERFTRGTISTLRGMGDGSKPLTGANKLIEGAVGKLHATASARLSKGRSKKGIADIGTAAFGELAKAMGIGITTILGMNAAKFEDYEKSQRRMADAGAIFLEGEEKFHDLYKKSILAGVGYDQFTQAVQQSGTTLAALGDGVSVGQSRFLDMFKDLNDGANQFGDYGLQSSDMMSEFLQYVEMERLKGNDISGEAVQEKLLKGFDSLMFESIELANLTGITASEQRKILANMAGDKLYQAGLGRMNKNQQLQMSKAVSFFGSKDAPMSQMMLKVFRTIGVTGGDDIAEAINIVMRDATNGEKKMLGDLLNDGKMASLIEKNLDGGNVLGKLSELFAVQSAKNTEATVSVIGGSTGLEYQERNASLALSARQLKNTRGDSKNTDSGKPESATISDKLKKSGAIVSAMNEFGIMIKNLTETILLPLDKTSKSLWTISAGFRSFVEMALLAQSQSQLGLNPLNPKNLTMKDDAILRLQESMLIKLREGYRVTDNRDKDGNWVDKDGNNTTPSFNTIESLRKTHKENSPQETDRINLHDGVADSMKKQHEMRSLNRNPLDRGAPAGNGTMKNNTQQSLLDNNSKRTNISNSTPASIMVEKLTTNTLQNHKNMLQLTEELKNTVSKVKMAFQSSKNSIRHT